MAYQLSHVSYHSFPVEALCDSLVSLGYSKVAGCGLGVTRLQNSSLLLSGCDDFYTRSTTLDENFSFFHTQNGSALSDRSFLVLRDFGGG